MEDHRRILSLSDIHINDSIPNQSSSSSSSSPTSSFDEDFIGFFSPSYNIPPENIVFCGKVVSSKQPTAEERNLETKTQTSSPVFRSTSDSLRCMRLKTASSPSPSTPRSKSLPNVNRSPWKSRWQVFMFGRESRKFPTKMEVSDLKSRQQSTNELGEESGGRTSTGEKAWWRLVDVLGCSAGYERDTRVVI